VMTISEVVKVLDKVQKGLHYASSIHMFGVNESTLQYKKKNEKAIHNTVMAGAPASAKAAHQVRDKTIVKIENALFIWLEDHNKKSVPVNSNIIRKKAKSLYDRFKIADGGEGTNASVESH